MIPFRVTLAQRPRRPPDVFAGTTPAPSSLIFLSTADQRFRFCRKGSPNSFALTLLADPHPLNLIESHCYKNIGGRGHLQFSPLVMPENTSRIHSSFQSLARCPSRNSFLLITIHFHGGCADVFLNKNFNSAGISTGMNNLAIRNSNSFFVELIALLVGHPGDAQADQHGRSDQNQDATLERRNHAGTGARRLRIAERAILRVGKRRNGQRRSQSGHAGGDSCDMVHHTAHFLSEYLSREERGQHLRESGGSGASLSAASPRRPLSAQTAACAAGGCCPTRSYSSSAGRRWWPGSARGTNCASHAPGA